MIGRRTFLRGIAATAATTTLGDPVPPTPSRRRKRQRCGSRRSPGSAWAPQYVASELLRLEDSRMSST